MTSPISDKYPTEHRLEDGAKITCHLMSADDRVPLSKFLDRLSSRDLQYLQVDITKPEAQERWLEHIELGNSYCICAYDPATMVGYASVHISDRSGAQRGEIRVNISQGYRSRGLGKLLIQEIFSVAKMLELESVYARMMSDQPGAVAAFKHLGFVEDPTLRKPAKNQAGAPGDLIVMTSDL